LIYELSFRDESRNVGGPVLGGRLSRLTPPAFGRAARDSLITRRRIVFLLHGYNVSLARGRGALKRFAELLPSHQGDGLVTTLWPGDSWMGFASFPFEGRNADDSAASLARFIADTVPASTPIAFVSHSLGGRVALGAMNRLHPHFRIEQVCVLAAAVDDSSPADVDVYRPGVEGAQRVSVLSSTKDRVLLGAYPIGRLTEAFVFFWREQAGLALGWHGPRPARGLPIPSNVEHEAIPEDRNAGHGDYLPPHDPAVATNAEQDATAKYVDAVLSRATRPTY